MYPRLRPGVAQALARRLRPMAPAAHAPPFAVPAELARVVICATDDELFDPASERATARELLGVDAIEIPGGHFPMAEAPAVLAELLDRIARDQAGSHIA